MGSGMYRICLPRSLWYTASAFGSLSSLWALRILSRTGSDPAALLGVILGFFGGELLLLSLKTILTNRKEDNLEQHL